MYSPLPLPGEEGTTKKTFKALSPESEGQNMALTVLHVPHSLESGISEIPRTCQDASHLETDSIKKIGTKTLRKTMFTSDIEATV